MVIEGSTLYVGLRNADEVARIDTGTLAPQRPLGVHPANRPYRLAWAGNRLWVAFGECSGGFDDGVVAIDPSSGHVTTFGAQAFADSCPVVVGSPRLPDRLFASGSSPPGAVEYGVSGQRLRPVVSLPAAGLGTRDAAVSPDGHFLLAAGNGNTLQSFSVSTLQSSGTDYVADSYVTGVNVTAGPDPRVAVGSYTPYGKDVWVYRASDPQAYASFDLGEGQEGGLYDGGVALSPDGERVFVVSGNEGNDAGAEALFRVIHA